MKWVVPLADPNLDEAEALAAADVLRSGWLTQGSKVQAFERAFAAMLGARHGVAVTNGTAALHLAYAAAGLGPGDEFIVPCLTFVATINAGLYLGARPVLADCVSADDLTISIEDVERKITPRTRLIVTLPYGGFCPDMPAFEELARENAIPLVEDACHAPLAHIDGRCMGTFGLAGTFSFFSNKNLVTGEGGMVVTDDDGAAEEVRRLRSHGMTSLTWERHQEHAGEYDVTRLGYNYRLDEMRAAIGLVQLGKLRENNQRRTEAAGMLREALENLDIPGLAIPFSKPRGVPVHHIFVILLPEGADRGAFRRKMSERGIQTSLHYPLPHRFAFAREVFADPDKLNLPVVESLASRLVTLPMGPHLTGESVRSIAEAVGKALGRL